MTYRIKSWQKFQHYKERKPPWIKLYRELLDDIEWFRLPGDASKVLVMLWLIGSENNGELPEIKELAFRLRITEQKLNDSLSRLSHWLEHDDRRSLASRKQDATLETETETETEMPSAVFSFDEIWNGYPNKDGRKSAERSFFASVKTAEDWESIQKALKNYLSSDRVSKGFLKNGATWFNNWRDWIVPPVTPKKEEPAWDQVNLSISKKN